MKIYLLNPPYYRNFGREMRWQNTGRGGTLYYPIWLAYASGALEKEGFTVRLVDAPAWDWDTERVIRDVMSFSPDIIVMSTSFTSLANDIKVSRQIKNSVNKLMVMVGPPTSRFSTDIIQSGIDISVRNEYDFTMVNVANALRDGRQIADVPGVSWLDNGEIRHNADSPWSTDEMLDSAPFVSETYKKHLNIKDYFLTYSLYPMMQIFGGRGCPFNCSFCSWPQSFTGRKYRARNVSNILDELEWIEKNTPAVREVFFEDDTFTLDKKRVAQFCEEYVARKLKVNWSCNARVDTLDYVTMVKMKRANCRFLIIGFESANDQILQSIKKGITTKNYKQFALDVKKSGLFLHADFIIGLPGENKETIGNTWRFIKEIKPDQLQVSVASPFPGTEFYDWAKANGYLTTDDPNEYLDERGHQKSIISYPWLNNFEIVREVDRILKGYYLSPAYIPVALGQILNKNMFSEIGRFWHSVLAFMQYIGHK